MYWVNTREVMRVAKEQNAPFPLTDDPVMNETYFCNVHREDDRVTRWIRQNYGDTVTDVGVLEANMVMARLVNRISSLEAMGWPWVKFDRVRFMEAGHMLKPFWGNAYLVSTHGQRISKVEYACGVLQAAWDALPIVGVAPTLATYHKALRGLEGFGSFMAAQVVADLKNTPDHPLYEADDWWLWSAHGPGSLKGLSYFWDKKVTPRSYDTLINEAWGVVHEYVPAMCMQDFQNCFCEYGKYMRVKYDGGKSKRRYVYVPAK